MEVIYCKQENERHLGLLYSNQVCAIVGGDLATLRRPATRSVIIISTAFCI